MPDYPKLTTTYSIRRTDKEVQKNLDPKYQGLHKAISMACQSNDANSLSLLLSVQAELNRYGLARSESASDVLHIALLRGKKTIDNGKIIPNPSAWLRLTCRYVIKEKKRGSQREAQFDSVDSIAAQPSEDIAENAYSGKYSALAKELQRLSDDDRELLTLKVVHELSWEEIQIRLVDMGYPKYSLAALRKRKSRAVQRLRQNLADVYAPSQKEHA